MRPVTVKEILICGERLGITEMIEPSGVSRSVRRLCRYGGGEPGEVGMPLPHSLCILSGGRVNVADENRWSGPLPQSLCRNISCLALPAQRISPYLRNFSEKTKTAVFSSYYDDSLLHSRLTGLLREKGDRRVMVHAVLVQVCGFGVLLLGESGIGKTACGLALMAAGNRWVADDAVLLEGRGESVYGRGHFRTRGWIAVRGKGILRAADLLGPGLRLQETRVDLLIRLVRGGRKNAVENRESLRQIVGVSLPCRDLAADVNPWRMAEQVADCIRGLSVKSSGSASTAATA